MVSKHRCAGAQWILVLLTICFGVVSSSKVYTGQRVFVDTQIIDFADPAKHGFHIVLNEDFVSTHLQPIRLPTVFATAIALKQASSQSHQKRKNDNTTSGQAPATSAAALNDGMRVTKILYPENVSPDDGLLDGRTIKLLGLRERTWYYVCVEFESNLNRHELATGTSCQLKRTLDKFGKTADSTVSDVELSEISDRSISVKLRVDTDFPIRLSVYLSPERAAERVKATPAQIFIVERSQTLNANFIFLDPDTSYGSVCVFEEPLPTPTTYYTAMARAVSASMQHCYFGDLKTNPVPLKLNAQEKQQLQSPEYSKSLQQSGKRALPKPNAAGSHSVSLSQVLCSLLVATSLWM